MHFSKLDLNLMKVFDAMMRTRSVTRAADMLGLTQPAASRALLRLRRALGDPLFVPTSNGMQPTPRALRIGDRIEHALTLLNGCLDESQDFVPSRTKRTFTMFVSDIGNIVILPPLLAYLKEHAPGTSVQTVMSSFKSLGKELESGEVDLAVSVMPALGAGFFQQTLFKDRYVCIVRTHHPSIGDKITLKNMQDSDHLIVNAEGTGHEIIEKFLIKSRINIERAIRIPHFLAAPLVVSESDLIATVPNRLAQAFTNPAFSQAIRILEHPMRSPSYSVKQFWHTRYHHDPGHQWLRKVLIGLFANQAGA